MKTQLQFSLGAAPSAANLAIRHQKLDPIVVEKVGHNDSQRIIPPLALNVQKALQFSVLSKEKLEMAVQLAKRDMKKKKAGEQIQGKNYRGHGTSRSRSPSPQLQGHTKIVRSREYRDRQRRQEIKKKTAVLHVRERVGKGNFSRAVKQKSSSTITKPPWNSDGVNASSLLPATTNSPPTKDANLNPRKALTKDEQQTAEISRLQCEIQLFLSKIQTMVQNLVDGGQSGNGVSKLRGEGALYLGEEEGEVRRKMRMEEQAARSARTLYFLKQQVRGIQDDFTRFGAEKIRQTKRSQTLTRLLSALRGGVRALQTFITQLQSHMTRDGPPQGHAELSALMKQLTSLCSQMGEEQVDGKQIETDHADIKEITRVLDLLNELFSVWEQEAHIIRASEVKEGSPDRQQHRGRNRDNRRNGANKRHPKPHLGRHLSPAKSKAQALRRQPAKPSSPERKAALKAGVAALVKRDAAVQRLTAFRGDDRRDNTAAPPKGLLLPQYLQLRGRPAAESSTQGAVSGHFAEPTMAFSLKAVGPRRNPITQPRSSSAPTSPRALTQDGDLTRSPPWIPSGTPQRPSPKPASARSRSHSPRGCGTCAQYRGSLEDVSVELFSEERKPRPVKGHVHFARSLTSSPIRSRSPSPASRRRKRSPAHCNSRDIQRRLEPLYSQSEMLSKKQETRVRTNLEQRKNFRLDSDLDKQTQGEVLTELLFNDLLTEAANEFQTIEGDNSVSQRAQSMLHNPSLEVMMQRLKEMEIEEEEIRRRWTSVNFGSEAVDVAPSSVMPCDPTPIEISSIDQQKPYKRLPSNQASWNPIMFTKPGNTKTNSAECCTRSRGGNTLKPAGVHNSVSSLLPPGITPQIKVQLSEEILKEIWENVENYERYLKRNSHHAAGEFNPWQLIKEVSDEILEDCLTEVAGELEDMSSDIVNHLYKAEFVVTSDTPP